MSIKLGFPVKENFHEKCEIFVKYFCYFANIFAKFSLLLRILQKEA